MGAGSSIASDSDCDHLPTDSIQSEVESLRKVVADIDAEELNRAIIGSKPDEALLISIFCNRTKEQLLRIDSSYQVKFGSSIITILENVGGSLEKVAGNFFRDASAAGYRHFKTAFDGFGYKSEILSDILCCYTNVELAAIKQYYDGKEGSLFDRVKKELGGSIFKLTSKLIMESKNEGNEADISLSVSQADELHEAGMGRSFGTDDDVFINILATSSRAQIQAIKAAYVNEYKLTLEEAVTKKFGKDMKRILLGLLCSSREMYIANALHEALEGWFNNDDRVLRLLSLCSKTQMSTVKQIYQESFGESLSDALKNDYKKGTIQAVVLTWCLAHDPTEGFESKNILALQSGAEDTIENLKKECSLLLDFVAMSDAMNIKRATYGKGTRDRALISIICARNRSHLQQVDSYFQDLFEASLVDLLQSEADGYYRILMQYAVTPIEEVDAIIVKNALDSYGENEYLLPDSLVPLSNKRIQKLKAQYRAKYNECLKERIENEIPGDMRVILLAVLRGDRNESRIVDRHDAKEHAKKLHKMKERDGEVDLMELIDIILSSSIPHIAQISLEFEKRYEMTLENFIRGETDGPVESALASLLLSSSDSYAVALHRAFNESDTDDATVARIFGSNDKLNLHKISDKYKAKYGQSLREALEFHLTGNFRVACITCLASSVPILPEDLKAIINTLPSDGDEHMPSKSFEIPEVKKNHTPNKKGAKQLLLPVIQDEDDDIDTYQAAVDDEEEGSEHDSDIPEQDGWEMTPELQKLFKMRGVAKRNNNKYKFRMITKTIRHLIAEQHG